MKTVRVNILDTYKDFTKRDIKTLWDPSQTFSEATKYDSDKEYIYSYTNTRQLYVKCNGARIPISVRLEDFEED